MKRLLLIFVIGLTSSCSFDNKTGIWKDASNFPVEIESTEPLDNTSRYEDIFIEENQLFNEEKETLNISGIKIDTPIKILTWSEQYAISTNNISNFSYKGNNKILSKGKKLNKFESHINYKGNSAVFYKENLISYDHKGTIFMYSIGSKKKIFKYNFYKKNFKNYEKKIKFLLVKDTLYAADNLGYLYSINLNTKSLIWAKNYGIPFRSNLKLANGQIFLANQDNVIYAINASTGNEQWQFATSLTFLKTDFQNNFALDKINNNLLFLNTSGELYSINYVTQKINWVLNFKNSSTFAGDFDLFLSQPILIKKNNFFISTEKTILSYNLDTISRNWSFPISTLLKPIITNNYIFIISKSNLLICLDNKNGEVIWSKNIFNDLNTSKLRNKIGKFYDFKIVNNEINLYSKNGYLLSFNFLNGKKNYLNRISKKGISSKVFFIKDFMYLFDKNNKLLKYN